MRSVDEAMQAKDKYRTIIEKTNEALLTYVDELKRVKRFLLDNAEAPSSESSALE
jgi:hypothetical protein